MHWNGSSWSGVASPDLLGANSWLNGVSGSSINDVWAVGNANPGQLYHNLAMHLDGTAWTIVPMPNPGTVANYLFAVTTLTPSNAWAVGQWTDSSGMSHPLTLHWDGGAWTVVPSPNGAYGGLLYSLKAFSANDVWAVGDQYPYWPCMQTLAMHWDGTAWTIVPSLAENTNSFLWGVTAVGHDDVWAVGTSTDFGPSGAVLIEHWNGTVWQIGPYPIRVKLRISQSPYGGRAAGRWVRATPCVRLRHVYSRPNRPSVAAVAWPERHERPLCPVGLGGGRAAPGTKSL